MLRSVPRDTSELLADVRGAPDRTIAASTARVESAAGASLVSHVGPSR
jgi:hypothetical protein